MRKWVDALRSGEYTQWHGALCHISHGADGSKVRTYCCLGVACELALADGVPLVVQDRPWYRLYDGSSSSLPRPVARWLGMEDLSVQAGFDIPLKNLDGTETVAIGVNDHEKLTFAQIADLIELTYLQDE